MINLAGRNDCDEHIARELRYARITAWGELPGRSEVPSTIVGRRSP